jgi:hypothetical protein
MLDSLGSVCPGQAGSEYPATSVPFSNAPWCIALLGLVGWRVERDGGGDPLWQDLLERSVEVGPMELLWCCD